MLSNKGVIFPPIGAIIRTKRNVRPAIVGSFSNKIKLVSPCRTMLRRQQFASFCPNQALGVSVTHAYYSNLLSADANFNDFPKGRVWILGKGANDFFIITDGQVNFIRTVSDHFSTAFGV